jgi:hypothetical protein
VTQLAETLWSVVDDEARHEWLDELPQLRADARPHPSEYEDLKPRRTP